MPTEGSSCFPGLGGERTMLHSAFQKGRKQSENHDETDCTKGRDDIDEFTVTRVECD